MNRVFYALLWLISKLPLSVLYLFTDFLFVLNYYFIGYRKSVVINNLEKAMPKLSNLERKKISKKFFKNLSDYLAETLKAITISQKKIDERHTYKRLEVFDEFKKEGRNVMLLAGHIFNWEWFIGTVNHLPSENTHAIYHEIHNEFWNERVNEIRSRFGTSQIEMKETVRQMMRIENDGEHTFFFVADQKPAHGTTKTFIPFFDQQTPVFEGFAKLAAKLNLGLVYCDTQKIKKGHYQTTFKKLENNKDSLDIIHQFYYELQNTIERNPDNWLWSHRRWKYQSL